MRMMPFLSFSLLFLLLLSHLALAGAGMRLPTQEDRTVIFEPGAVHEWVYNVYGADYLAVTIGGELAPYAEMEDPNPGGGPRAITFTVTLPEELPPGEHQVWAVVTESAPEGMMGARSAVKGRVIVYSLYDIPFIDAKLSVDNTGNGSDAEGRLTLKSWSTVTIPVITTDISIPRDDGEAIMKSLLPAALAPQEEKVIDFTLPTASLPQGDYTAEAVITYGKNQTDASAAFKIGALEFRLVDYTPALVADETNRFSFTVASDWKDAVSDVYGVVTLLGLAEKTPTVEVRPFQSAELKTYFDLGEGEIGTYPGSITLFYAGTEQEFPISVDLVTEGAVAVQEPQETESSFNMILLLYIFLILLVIINVILLFWRGRKKRDDDA